MPTEPYFDANVKDLGHGVLRIRAGNPSPLTGTGSNSYLLRGDGGAVLVDAGPDLAAHIAALMAQLNALPLRAILITHPHLDHSGAAAKLAAQTGARVYSFGPTFSKTFSKTARAQGAGGHEGRDSAHLPDETLQDGARITFAGLTITALHTPGHMRGHLCFGHRDMLFSGDHVMGWSTTLVAPPDGDMADYRASLRKLQGLGYTRYLPGHGEVIADPRARLAELIAHRNQREAQILAALAQGPNSARALAQHLYTDTPHALLPAAALNVLAHLVELAAKGRVQGAGAAETSTPYTLL